MRLALAAFLVALSLPAQAQFKFDLNRALDSVKSLARATQDIDETQEVAIGRDVAARLLGAARLVDNAPLQRYVNRVGRWLASQSERPDLPWRFGVLDAPQVNAFAVPGGTVLVTRGLLERLRNEAELAGVLGHEIAHVLKKHHLQAIQKNARAELAGDALSMLESSNPQARDKLVRFGSEMYARGLDKSDELEADRLGVVLAARGGYDPYGLVSVLQTLQAMNAQDSALALLFKTHPAPEERLQALESLQPTLDAYASQPQLASRFSSFLGSR